MSSNGNSSSGRKISPHLILWIVVAVLVIIFIAQNTEKATISFLFLDIQTGVWFAFLVALLLGMVLGWLLPKLRDNE